MKAGFDIEATAASRLAPVGDATGYSAQLKQARCQVGAFDPRARRARVADLTADPCARSSGERRRRRDVNRDSVDEMATASDVRRQT
jgi:hypothetical protein